MYTINTAFVKNIQLAFLVIIWNYYINNRHTPGDRHPMPLFTLHIMSDVYVSRRKNSVVTWVHLSDANPYIYSGVELRP